MTIRHHFPPEFEIIKSISGRKYAPLFPAFIPKETTVHERIERQYKAQMAFYDHLSARTQAARDLIAKESRKARHPLDK